MIGRVLRLKPEVGVRRERWDTPDGDFLDLDFALPGPASSQAPVRGTVLVLHGLEGSSTRSYVRLTLAHLRRLGLQGVALNFRSCSGPLNRRARFYHSGETGDLAHVVTRLKEESPQTPLAAIGFSLGGNVLLKYLGETVGDSGLAGAVAVSVPFDLAIGARLIGTGMAGRVYTQYFLRSLKRKLAAKAQAPECDPLAPEMVRRGLAARHLVEYDDVVTAPLHGFQDAASYYAASSSASQIASIAVPTIALHAADDPFLPAQYLPKSEADSNPQVTLHVTAKGGHLGFLESEHGFTGSAPPAQTPREARFRLRCWVEGSAAEAVDTLLQSGRPD